MKKILTILILLTGCTGVEEILPGLCYTDEKGSYFCEEEELKEKVIEKIHEDLCYYDENQNRICPA